MMVTPHGSVELAHSELFLSLPDFFVACQVLSDFCVAGNPRPSGQSNAREPTRGN